MKDQLCINAIIFDLDGTLIDSASSILAGFAAVLSELQLTPCMQLEESLIGPPLRKTLQMLTSIDEVQQLDEMVEHFKAHYDTNGYQESKVYPGVAETLAKLKQLGIPMAIATNKRRVPTLKILSYLGWDDFFVQVGTLDTHPTPFQSKADLLASMLVDLKFVPGSTLYVGDKEDDALAAEANGMPFAAATWGYGEWGEADTRQGRIVLGSPALIAMVSQDSLRLADNR